MSLNRSLTFLDQTIIFLREGVADGRWTKGLPGVRRLAAELGVSPSTVQKAIRRLEQEGVIVGQGLGRSRVAGEISAGPTKPRNLARKKTGLRVGWLIEGDAYSPSKNAFVLSVTDQLEQAGHHPFVAPQSMDRLRNNPGRILAMLAANPADAWIGVRCWRSTLEAIAENLETPFLASGGMIPAGLNLATAITSVIGATRACTRRLLELGHRRIVLVCPEFWRKPVLSKTVINFHEDLAAAGVQSGDYNVPEWTPTKEGFAQLLHSLFSLTPPTAMIVRDACQAVAVMSFLAARGRSVPRHLSLVTVATSPELEWCTPSIAYFDTKGLERRLQRRIVRWVNACAAGTQDRKRVSFDATFVDGESVAAPAK